MKALKESKGNLNGSMMVFSNTAVADLRWLVDDITSKPISHGDPTLSMIKFRCLKSKFGGSMQWQQNRGSLD